MSYINEALKKAQKKREANYQDYSGVTSRPIKRGRLLPGNKIFWISLIFVFLAAACALYYRFTFKTPAIATTPGYKPEKVLTKGPPESIADPEEIYNKAKNFHKAGRSRDAKRLYRETLRLAPGHVDALNNLGVLLIQDRNFIAARRNFEKAVRLQPGNVDPYYNLACVCAAMGDTKKSLAYLKKAVSLDKSAINWAQKDEDLQKLRGLPEFKKITGHKD